MSAAYPDNAYELKPTDALYPKKLLDLSDAPERLYVRGDPSVLSVPALSVIGSRRATPYGLTVAEMAGKLAAESDLAVVSGGAKGCDQAAGWGALKQGGKHIVVLGSGADVVYPRSSEALVRKTIETGGAVVSLCPWGMGPRRYAFPKRNRIIAALSEALLIAEAGMPSGTFSTAETAMEIGRELLVAPGSIISPESRGSNYLISIGACCVVDEQSIEMAISRIYGKLRFQRAEQTKGPLLNTQEEQTLHALTAAPLRVDAIQAMLGCDAVSCITLLGSMEAEGYIERLIDGRYAPTKFALFSQTPLMAQ